MIAWCLTVLLGGSNTGIRHAGITQDNEALMGQNTAEYQFKNIPLHPEFTVALYNMLLN